jgi:hypothetical protein
MTIQRKTAPAPVFYILSGIGAVLFGLIASPRNLMGWTLVFWGTGLLAESFGFFHYLWHPGERFHGKKSAKNNLAIAGILAVSIVPGLDFLTLPAILPRAQWLQDAGLILCALSLLLLIRSKISWECLLRTEASEAAIIRGMQNETDPPNRFLEFAGVILWAFGICIGFGSLAGIAATMALLVPGILPQKS